MMRCGEFLGVLNKDAKWISLMYSTKESSFSKEFIKDMNEGKFIKD